MDPRIAELLEAQDVDGLLALEPADKAEKKAIKRALFLLKQRGVHVPDAPRTPAPGATLKAAALPVLMGEPTRDDGRLFTFAVQNGGDVIVVEARFEMPIGLKLLKSSKSTRPAYAQWCTKMVKKPWRGRPERVRVDAGMLGRKQWEIRQCFDEGRLGPDVDGALARKLARGGGKHPAVGLSGRDVSVKKLYKAGLLEALLHEEPLTAIRRQPYGRRDATAEWVGEWGEERAAETLLDLAAYAAGLSEPDMAATLSRAATDPVAFLQDVVDHHL